MVFFVLAGTVFKSFFRNLSDCCREGFCFFPLVKNKKDHAYNKKLSEYKEKEKVFLAEVKKKTDNYKTKVDTSLPKSVQKLQIRLFKAKELVKFYQNYVKLTYDAELIYEQSKLEIAQIPPVIEFAKECAKELK